MKRKLFTFLVALLAMCGLSANAADKVIGQRFTSIEDLDGKLFAVVSETSAKAMGIGITGHGSGWDMYFGTYNEAYASNACYYKISTAQGDGLGSYYYLQAYNSAGGLYDMSWAPGGYFNSQTGTGGYFALGLNGRNGQDALNHAVWAIEVSGGKFALKNVGTGKYLHDDQKSNTYTDPFYFTFCTLIDDPLPAAQEKYNSLKNKYLAINTTLDVADAEALFTSATTVDEVQAAIDKLISIFGASLANGANLTGLITNPSFESNLTGWTNNGMAAQNNKVFGGTVENIYCEAWQPNGTKGVSQTLSGLPQGLYRLSANALARGVTSAKIFAGDKGAAITIVDASNTYDMEFFSDGADVTIGFQGVGTGAGTSWICVDNFQLTYVQNMTAEEYADYEAYNDALAAYNKAMTAAQDIANGTIPTTAYTNLQNTINANTVTSGTTSQYNNAATALNNAVNAAQPLITPYAEYLDTKAGVITMKDADTYTGADAKSTLEGVINSTLTNVEAATSATTITTETANLVAAAKTFVKTVTIKADQYLDLTCLIKNHHFKYGEGGPGKVASGWTLESGSITEHRLLTHNFEAWHRQFNLSQTITDLPKGTYKVTLQGFARHDDGAVTDKTNLYCGIVNQPIKNITDEYSTTSLISGKPNMGDGNGESKDGDNYRPNGMSGSYYFFQETNAATGQPFYTNEVQTLITEPGDLKIGFKCETNTDWVIWDNFHLYYYGSAIAVTINEDAASSSYSEDIESANITLTRTIKADTWNTIFLPFDLNDAETKAAFGSDAQVATFSEEASGTNSTVNFNIVASDAAITANTPVLLKTSTAGTSYSFNGKTIKAGEAIVAGTNFNFVGTYAASTTIAENDYFIKDNKLYKSSGATTIKGTRAYLKNVGGNSTIKSMNIFDEEGNATAIDATEIEGLTIGGKIYDLSGREVKTPVRGLYIQNGKKVFIK